MAKVMRKVRTAHVVRTRMDKTAVVEMVWKQRHRLYRKQVRRVARFYVHDPEGQCRLGDTVRIEETRPISKSKHWRLLEVMERRQVADVRPIELEADAELPAAGSDEVMELEAEETSEESEDESSSSGEEEDEEEEEDSGQ
ncbi:MAG: 30S ribosomal protein S17 [SAR202 cluster bacterium Io17-Chloro-G9]|nr:MAG: 30S ribosomal protein S17 [SAR202 cluster bacterium Io17-Chloro-G9]